MLIQSAVLFPYSAALLLGAILGFLLGRQWTHSASHDRGQDLRLDSLRYQAQAERVPKLETENQVLQEQVLQGRERAAAREAELTAIRNQSAVQVPFLEAAKEQLAAQFKLLAAEIMEEKVARFTEQNKAGLGEFQKKVEEVYVQEGKDRSALGEQVRQLLDLNHTLFHEAHSLTQALKGSSKTQGIWGEMILETILEAVGLRQGREYELRPTVHREDGSRAQPDVLIHLPDGKTIVVDSKVLLTAYEQYANAEEERDRAEALKAHLISVRNHIGELSAKSYPTLPGGERFDAAIMFVPLEPAFMAAIGAEVKLWENAWAKNIILVGPSTLLFVLRTIRQLWNQEQQNRNAQEIAKRGAELYDKLVGFVGDFEEIGSRLGKATEAYEAAMSKFSRGRGNAIRQAEMLMNLGVKPTKMLPVALVQQ